MLRDDPIGAVKRGYHRARGVEVASTAHLPLRARLSSRTSIGANTWINGAITCKGGGAIQIGAHCAVGEELLVTTTNHQTRHANMMLRLHWDHGFVDLDGSEDVSIGPACWIGDRVTVLGGARIGTGVVIAAGAVVPRGDYPDYAIVAGVPARVLRMRAAPEVVDVLVRSRWWQWPADRVARNRAFFELDIGTAEAATVRSSVVS